MSLKINVGSDELVKYTNRLERFHKSAFPNAVRTALNSAAFDVKKNTLLESADKEFINRSKNFFRANSRVEMAKGWELPNMVATAGMKPLGGSNYAVDDLEQQEHGGTIKKRSFIPMKDARTGKSNRRNVKRANRLSNITKMVVADEIRTRKTKSGTVVPVSNPRERFMVAVHVAGKGGFVLSKGTVFKVNSLRKTRGGNMKLTAIYSFKKNRSVKVQPTHFMEKAAKKSHKKLPGFYIREAEKQIKKYTGR